MTAEIPEEAVVAAANALLEAGFIDPDDGTIPQWRGGDGPPWWTHPSEAVKVALEAAAPLLSPRPLLDREAVRDVVALKAMFFRRGDDGRPVVGEYGQEPLANAVDAVMELARPMPTRDALAEDLRGCTDVPYLVAARVLALLNRACTCPTDADVTPDMRSETRQHLSGCPMSGAGS